MSETNTPQPPTEESASLPLRSSSVSSDFLLSGKTELWIRHNGETYCLRKTRLGKLILTK